MSSGKKTIIFVPGIRPKPPAGDHRDALWRCLMESVSRVRPIVAASMQQNPGSFHVVPWSFEFYRAHHDMSIDQPGLEELLTKTGPSRGDIAEATSAKRRWHRWLYGAADALPLLGRLFAPDSLRLRLSEIGRYFRNTDGIADRMRSMVKAELLKAWQKEHRVMLIGHSFGSVIAYDSLWELGYIDNIENMVDCFVTMGSPMGLRYVRDDLHGAAEVGQRRFPKNIRRWVNLAAVGEVTAHHPALKEMQAEMAAHGMLEEAQSLNEVITFFRGPDGLNVHKCYGYFYNEDTASIIADWWSR